MFAHFEKRLEKQLNSCWHECEQIETRTLPSSLVVLITVESFCEITFGGGGHNNVGFAVSNFDSRFKLTKLRSHSEHFSAECGQYANESLGAPTIKSTGRKSASMLACKAGSGACSVTCCGSGGP